LHLAASYEKRRQAAGVTVLALGCAIETIESVGEFADEQNQSGGLGIGFGAALLAEDSRQLSLMGWRLPV
jgi:hypothetical protein